MRIPDTIAIMVVNINNGKILISQRINCRDFKGFFQFPGGKVERKELIKPAALRELEEEAGFKAELTDITCIYCVTNDPTCEHCWIFKFVTEKRPKNREKKKATDWKWVSPSDVLKLKPLMPGIIEVIKREFGL
jgi:8-oxo-dGTP diphosphatase